jgi:hypothetical protein
VAGEDGSHIYKVKGTIPIPEKIIYASSNMSVLSGIGKILIVLGLVLTGLGILLVFTGKIPWFGRLPGDIYYKGKDFTFYFPLASSILISIILSLIMYFFFRK